MHKLIDFPPSKGQLIRWRIDYLFCFFTWIIYGGILINRVCRNAHKTEIVWGIGNCFLPLLSPALPHTNNTSTHDDIIWSLKLEKQGQRAIFIVKAFRMWSNYKLKALCEEVNWANVWCYCDRNLTQFDIEICWLYWIWRSFNWKSFRVMKIQWKFEKKRLKTSEEIFSLLFLRIHHFIHH